MKTKDLAKLIYPMPKRNLTAQEHRELVRCYHAYLSREAYNKDYYLCGFTMFLFPVTHELINSLLDTPEHNYITIAIALNRCNEITETQFAHLTDRHKNEIRLIWLRKLIAHRSK